METISNYQVAYSKNGMKMTIKPELTEKANKMKIALRDDPKIIESNRIISRLKLP